MTETRCVRGKGAGSPADPAGQGWQGRGRALAEPDVFAYSASYRARLATRAQRDGPCNGPSVQGQAQQEPVVA